MTLLGNFVRTSCREPLLQARQGRKGAWASRWRWLTRLLAHQQAIQTHQIDGRRDAGHLQLCLLHAPIAAAPQTMPTHAFGDGPLHPCTRRIGLLKGWAPLLSSALLQGLMHLLWIKRQGASARFALGTQRFGLTALTHLRGKAHADHRLATTARVGPPRLRELPLRTARLLLLPVQFKGAQSIARLLLPTGIQQHPTQPLDALLLVLHQQLAAEVS